VLEQWVVLVPDDGKVEGHFFKSPGSSPIHMCSCVMFTAACLEAGRLRGSDAIERGSRRQDVRT
jgi:hypothetical protein